MALNVDKVFRFIQFVANKESRGWVSPAEFNIAGELSQIMAYSKREAIFIATKKVLNDMRPFVNWSNVSEVTGEYPYPAGLRHLISARLGSNNQPIQELTQAELGDALVSTITAPTEAYPALVQREAGAEVYPASISSSIRMEYLKAPTAPVWAYTLVSARPVYDSGNSTDFEFDDILFPEIAINILAHVGLNIKEELVTQYAMAFNQGQ
jgi:hypothetical protein